MARLIRDRSNQVDVDWLARRQAVATHLQSLQVQLEAATFEADCSGDVLESIRMAIEQEESARELRWSLLSIVAGALGAVGAGTWELVDPDARGAVIVGLTGGAVSGALGIVAFVPQRRSIVLHHRRNLLRPIHVGSDPDHVYPTFVFRLLTLPHAHGPGSPRDDLLARFARILDDSVPQDQQERTRRLLYGDGGVYDVDLLWVRERMLDELEDAVAAGMRDLELLQRYLGRTLDPSWLQGPPRSMLSLSHGPRAVSSGGRALVPGAVRRSDAAPGSRLAAHRPGSEHAGRSAHRFR